VWFPNKLSRPAGLSLTSAGKITVAGPDGWGGKTPTKFQVARLHGGACPQR
jgi:hypothetical protein